MKTGQLIGPYAWQWTGNPQYSFPNGKLKFWFAMITPLGGKERFEITIDSVTHEWKSRNRPSDYPPGTSHSSNFTKYLIPADLTPYKAITFPRFKGDTIADAAVSMLDGRETAAAIARLRLGIDPLPKGEAHA